MAKKGNGVIQIHRKKPVVYVGPERVSLTKDEHALMIALGMMDNRLVPHDVLLDWVASGKVRIDADKDVLHGKVCRLKKKIGKDVLVCNRDRGYILSGSVKFIG